MIPAVGTVEVAGYAPVPEPTGIRLVSFSSALATSLTMPTHAAGDLIIIYAYRAGIPGPTVPDGTWTVLDAGSTTANSDVTAFKFAASGSETTGTWTNATGVIVHVYRTTGRWNPITIASTGGNSDEVEFPDLAARAGGGRYIRFSGHIGT